MTSGNLCIIACPMLDDNLVHELARDGDRKTVTVVENGNDGSIRRKLERDSVPYETASLEDVLSGSCAPDPGAFNVLIVMIDLGLHSEPEVLKSTVEKLTKDLQPHADAFGYYLGICGNYGWDIPAWCAENGLKPAAMFRDEKGNPCDDCVGVNISGGPRYLDLQRAYTGHFYVFPAMATNYDDFLSAGGNAAAEESLTDEAREALGIGPGRDGYIRWLLELGDYEYLLKLDTGIGEERFEDDLLDLSRRTGLKIKEADEGWVTLKPTADLYAECKSLLNGGHA
ncbi:MAG: DUF1638 domain-containing protein [Thermoplasmatales archaeon]|nr:DUF1638 domain-containing protein [Thermoplasmatales archaeon]